MFKIYACRPVKCSGYLPPALTLQRSAFRSLCIFVGHMILRINCDYFPKHHLQIGVCNVDAVFSVRQELNV
jgi:hypothetical protein